MDHWSSRADGTISKDPHALPGTIRDLEQAQDGAVPDAAAEQARREIASCDVKLRAHRGALEAGADPVIVTKWMAEVQAERTAAEARTDRGTHRQRLTIEQITAIVTSVRDMISVLASADPADKPRSTDSSASRSLSGQTPDWSERKSCLIRPCT